VTVAITDAFASPTIVKDTTIYNSRHGLPAWGRNQFSQITPGPNGYDNVTDCGGSGWYGEETLDVESVHAMAPGAKVVYRGDVASREFIAFTPKANWCAPRIMLTSSDSW